MMDDDDGDDDDDDEDDDDDDAPPPWAFRHRGQGRLPASSRGREAFPWRSTMMDDGDDDERR